VTKKLAKSWGFEMQTINKHFSKFTFQWTSHKSLKTILLAISLSLFAISGGKATAETIVTGFTSELTNNKVCEGTGGTLAYAETKDYSLYICADIKDIYQPKHYRSVNKNGTPGVKLTAKTYNPDQGTYFEFHNGDYVYMLQIPSGTIKNPVLMVEFPDGSAYEQKITRFLRRGDSQSPISNNQ
jgi:hypothetical protein